MRVFIMADSTTKSSKEVQPAASDVSHFRNFWPILDRDFDSLFHLRWPRFGALSELPGLNGTQPINVDVVDREGDVCVRAELPGYKKEDIDVSIQNNCITISASVSKDETTEEGDYHRREIVRGSASRTVSLPAEVQGEKASASLKEGVLEVIVPKSKRSPKQKVAINS
jgi:HSP20 family protein